MDHVLRRSYYHGINRLLFVYITLKCYDIVHACALERTRFEWTEIEWKIKIILTFQSKMTCGTHLFSIALSVNSINVTHWNWLSSFSPEVVERRTSNVKNVYARRYIWFVRDMYLLRIGNKVDWNCISLFHTQFRMCILSKKGAFIMWTLHVNCYNQALQCVVFVSVYLSLHLFLYYLNLLTFTYVQVYQHEILLKNEILISIHCICCWNRVGLVVFYHSFIPFAQNFFRKKKKSPLKNWF